MWDVKHTAFGCISASQLKFYMNYVGCKDFKVSVFYFSFFMFYMNYVGCKVVSIGFLKFFQKMFYMNYVGCKVGFNATRGLLYFSFI